MTSTTDIVQELWNLRVRALDSSILASAFCGKLLDDDQGDAALSSASP